MSEASLARRNKTKKTKRKHNVRSRVRLGVDADHLGHAVHDAPALGRVHIHANQCVAHKTIKVRLVNEKFELGAFQSDRGG